MKVGPSLVAVVLLVASPAAVADDGNGSDAGQGGIWTHVSHQNLTPAAPTTQQVTPTFTETTPGLDELFCTGINWSEACLPEEGGPAGQALTGEMVAQAFAFTPLPPSTLIIQPPNGRTLVNFATNFYTDAPAEQIIPVTLLGQVVELRVWPARFTWHFGDGTSLATTERGSAYPALDITHEYAEKGDVAPSLDTTYAAEWRLQGTAAWQPVQGTVTIAGEPSALTVLTATPTLVG